MPDSTFPLHTKPQATISRNPMYYPGCRCVSRSPLEKVTHVANNAILAWHLTHVPLLDV